MESLTRTCALLAGLLVCCVLPGLMIADVEAAVEGKVKLCDIKTIETVIGDYEKNLNDPSEMAKIQQRLKNDGFDPKESDGKAEHGTKDAFVRLCTDRKVEDYFEAKGIPGEKAKQKLAEHLVGLLPEPTSEDGAPAEEEESKLCTEDTIAKVMKDYDKRLGDAEQTSKNQLQLRIGGFDPRGVDGITGKNTVAAYVQLCVRHKVEEHFEEKNYADANRAEQELATYLVGLLDEPKINLSSGGCGCSRNSSADAVYGFYPYLLGGDETQEVDFALLDRIGFYALVMDKTGEFQNDLNWNSKNANVSDFIHEAHRHRVKVDLTFYVEEWAEWNFGDISKVAKNIAKTAAIKFQKTERPIWHNILRLMEGTSSQTVDGVNLYFDYEKGPLGSSRKLQEIVTQVSDQLEESGSEATLNIILGLYSTDLKKLGKFKDLTNILVRDKDKVDKVFIFLPRNTKDSRKNTSTAERELRQKIEETFAESISTTVLRKIVPIVTPADIDHEALLAEHGGESQFELDLGYFQDNFAGVGLWPLPLKSASTEEQISKALIAQFGDNGDPISDSDDPNYVGEKLNQYAPQVCQFVCPNRLLVYIALGLLVTVLITFALLALFNCRLREVYKRFFLVFLALGMLIPIVISISFSCDPAWAHAVDSVAIGFLVLVIAWFVWGRVRKAARPKLP